MDKSLLVEAAKHLRLGSICLFEGNLRRFADLPEAGGLGQQTKLGVKKAGLVRGVAADGAVAVFRVLVDLGVRVINQAVAEGGRA